MVRYAHNALYSNILTVSQDVIIYYIIICTCAPSVHADILK